MFRRCTRFRLSPGLLIAGGVLFAGGCDATQLRKLGDGMVAIADFVDPQPEPDLGDVISSEVEDFFDKL